MKLLAVFFSLLAAAGSALAQDAYPNRPITVVVPYPPGGTTDVVPRIMQVELTRRLGVPVVIENRGGAGGTIGAAQVARAKPDGYTLAIVNSQIMAINPWVYKGLSYDTSDFIPILNVGAVPNVLAVHPSVPAKNLQELIALATAKPGEVSYASSGEGSTSHLCGALLALLTGTKLLHVPYKGPAPAHQDLAAARVTMMCDALSNLTGDLNSDRLRGLAVAAQKRHPAVPKVPSAPEAGLPNLEMAFFIGFAAPKGTPPAIVARLNREMAAIIRTPEITKRLEGMGMSIDAGSPAEFSSMIASETAKYQKVVEAAGAGAK